MQVNILGTKYNIYENDIESSELRPKDRAGYCFLDAKEIHIECVDADKDWIGECEEVKKIFADRLLRHEIIHAFLFESGLNADSGNTESWATNEEIVDWIAIQFPKILKAFQDTKCI